MKVCRIRNKVSGYYLLPEYSGTRPNVRGMHHWPIHDPDARKNGFSWVLVPLDEKSDIYWIVNSESGFAMMPEYSGTRRDEYRGVNHWPLEDPDTVQKGFLWKLEAVGDYYRIKNLQSEYYLLPEWSGTRPDVRGLHHWPITDSGAVADGFLWQIEEVRKIPLPAKSKELVPTLTNPQMTSYDLPGSISVGLTGAIWLPFTAVQDPSRKEGKWKLENSPYYLLERETTWVTDPSRYHNNQSSGMDKRSWARTKSWTREQSKSFSLMTGIETKVGGKIKMVDVEATFKIEMTFGWSESFSETTEEQDTIEIEIPPATAKSLFIREDRMILRRQDYTSVHEWINYSGTATASYPPASD